MECGSFGVLETFEPTLSSLIWTSIATGKQPPKHGITGLTRKDPSDASQQLFNNRN